LTRFLTLIVARQAGKIRSDLPENPCELRLLDPREDQSGARRGLPDLDELGLLNKVPTLTFHMHLPHYALTHDDGETVRVLARQPVDLERPHPFIATGNKEFNSVLWLPPRDGRAGDIVIVDMTHFTTLFGGIESITNFWRNLATR